MPSEALSVLDGRFIEGNETPIVAKMMWNAKDIPIWERAAMKLPIPLLSLFRPPESFPSLVFCESNNRQLLNDPLFRMRHISGS